MLDLFTQKLEGGNHWENSYDLNANFECPENCEKRMNLLSAIRYITTVNFVPSPFSIIPHLDAITFSKNSKISTKKIPLDYHQLNPANVS